MSYHLSQFGAFQKESGELEDLPEGEGTDYKSECPPGMLTVRDYTKVPYQGNVAWQWGPAEACVTDCPTGFAIAEAPDETGAIRRNCIPRSTYDELRVMEEYWNNKQKPHEAAVWTPAKKVAATAAGAGALLLLALLL